ncbi:MAG TPA: VOC family protein [Gemmataceae bacterium]|nr:VOC family protein [Gemmataceae bacterium]
MFQLQGLDHVAIAVRDVERSAAWYQDVLGLERRHEAAWGNSPAMVGAGTTAIALFAVEGSDPNPRPGRDTLTMRHFAFRVDRANFAAARVELSRRGIHFTTEHHGIAESIYFNDPDGHELEITTYEV